MRMTLALIGLLAAAGAIAQSSNGPKRVALVVGNDGYKQVSTLLNARADATAIARSLEKAGFKVTLRTDVNLDSFKVALRSFKAMVSPGDEAVFFFSGHGVEMGGANYLLPVDIKGDAEDQVRDDAVPLQRVLEDLQERKARFSLAIIDACRNNPFRDAGRAIGGRGLAPTTAATGQMVLYSAGSGQQALDRLNDRDPVRNGVFTRVLLKEMEAPGVPVADVLRNVREQVASLAKSVGKEQVPAIYDQSLGRFYFIQPRAGATLAQAQTGQGEVAVPAALSKVDPAALDLAFWDSIKASQDRSDFEEYLRQFPEGRFSGLARNRMRQLSVAASPAAAPAPAPVAPAPAASAAANVEGIYQQANRYWNGTGVEKNEAEAVRLYRQAADRGHAPSQASLGLAYDLGRGIGQSYAEALKWYRRATDQGNARGQYLLGTLYENAQGVPKDLAAAARWYRLSADQGDSSGQWSLARAYERGQGVTQSDTEAVKWFRLSAEKGFAPAQNSLGVMYESGKGVRADNKEAVKWYRLAFDQGNVPATFNLADMYEFGKGIGKDMDEAMRLYRLAADQGNDGAKKALERLAAAPAPAMPAAQAYEEALRLWNGTGVAKNEAEAVRLFRIAADQGHGEAQASVGYAYDMGTGVAKSDAEALKWYRLSAATGNSRGQVLLGTMYEGAQGVVRDYNEAVKWYRLGANQGNAYGLNNLAGMYEFGKGVTKDMNEALRLYRSAADKGSEEAKKSLQRLGAAGSVMGADKAFEEANRHWNGTGVARNESEAVRFYRIAADQGHAEAQASLGYAYDIGKGVAKSDAEALKWYRLAAASNNARGQWLLGTMYEGAQGVAKDVAEAVKWYRLSANQGNGKGQTALGRMYRDGLGVAQNDAEAFRLFRLSVTNGNADANGDLAWCYENGRGVTKNMSEAIRLHQLAARQGLQYSRDALTRLGQTW